MTTFDKGDKLKVTIGRSVIYGIADEPHDFAEYGYYVSIEGDSYETYKFFNKTDVVVEVVKPDPAEVAKAMKPGTVFILSHAPSDLRVRVGHGYILASEETGTNRAYVYELAHLRLLPGTVTALWSPPED